MEKIAVALGTIVLGLVGLLFLSFLLSWPVYMLWNGCLVDAVEGVKQVTWLQAWGINFLFGILFKNSSVTKDSK
jgi:hypothetical protein